MRRSSTVSTLWSTSAVVHARRRRASVRVIPRRSPIVAAGNGRRSTRIVAIRPRAIERRGPTRVVGIVRSVGWSRSFSARSAARQVERRSKGSCASVDVAVHRIGVTRGRNVGPLKIDGRETVAREGGSGRRSSGGVGRVVAPTRRSTVVVGVVGRAVASVARRRRSHPVAKRSSGARVARGRSAVAAATVVLRRRVARILIGLRRRATRVAEVVPVAVVGRSISARGSKRGSTRHVAIAITTDRITQVVGRAAARRAAVASTEKNGHVSSRKPRTTSSNKNAPLLLTRRSVDVHGLTSIRRTITARRVPDGRLPVR